jgi:CheY-like chemotaxis protein
MTACRPQATAPLRILCLEDNPLIACHLQEMLEDLGHIFSYSYSSFRELQEAPPPAADGALVDIDLADGCTGPAAALWLHQRDIPTIFVTGQRELALQHADKSRAALIKPFSIDQLQHSLELLR